MEIKINDEVILKLSDIQKKVLMNDISFDIFEEDIARRLCYIIMHKHDQSLKRLQEEWTPKFKDMGKNSIPLNDEKFCEMVFNTKGYEDKQTRQLKEGK